MPVIRFSRAEGPVGLGFHPLPCILKGETMSTIRDRILAYLAVHPEGADDDQLAEVLVLKSRQQANSLCRQLATEGLVQRGPANGKIRNYATGAGASIAVSAADSAPETSPIASRPWYWEGNAQVQVAA